ncbi:LuxR family transcriptional regulator [Klebsiella sp. BIGb0407]|uniref:LuxR family transcriptional regulator n=1 Tax=Klebsiella sp. BIGb0407 TaxID=2940603 RepID=UPI0021676D0B|nr:LuxR family transcriptional regulator [Klebsiella sp. BIGb0407]MCS3433518.1 LuxR family quorum-sensing system transcriptional regulator ExpR [Klebsiella sp. BIGb0407]
MKDELCYKDFNVKSSESDNDNHVVKIIKSEMKNNFIESYAYLRINKSSNSVRLISSYPTEWLDIYVRNKYYEFDPVVQTAKYKITPFLWSKEENENNNIFEESREYSISQGLCFVAHRNENIFSILSLCNNDGNDDFFINLREKEERIQMLLLKSFEKDILEDANSNIKLTLREQEILKWVGLGKTYSETSLICGISERTVRFHLANILKKLDTSNIKHALTKAALYGFF